VNRKKKKAVITLLESLALCAVCLPVLCFGWLLLLTERAGEKALSLYDWMDDVSPKYWVIVSVVVWSIIIWWTFTVHISLFTGF
jgi:hypothetical protein